MTEPALEHCPKCQGRPRRLISGGAGLLFKGSGFYITDYRSKDYKASAAKDKPSPASSETSGSGGKSGSAAKPTTGKTD